MVRLLNNTAGFSSMHATTKTRSIQLLCEHFESFHNVAMGPETIFEMWSMR